MQYWKENEKEKESEKGEKQNGGQICQTLAYNRNMAWLIPLQSYKPGQLEQSSCSSRTMGHSAVHSCLNTTGKQDHTGRNWETEKGTSEENKPAMEEWSLVIVNSPTDYLIKIYMVKHSMIVLIYCSLD